MLDLYSMMVYNDQMQNDFIIFQISNPWMIKESLGYKRGPTLWPRCDWLSDNFIDANPEPKYNSKQQSLSNEVIIYLFEKLITGL